MIIQELYHEYGTHTNTTAALNSKEVPYITWDGENQKKDDDEPKTVPLRAHTYASGGDAHTDEERGRAQLTLCTPIGSHIGGRLPLLTAENEYLRHKPLRSNWNGGNRHRIS